MRRLWIFLPALVLAAACSGGDGEARSTASPTPSPRSACIPVPAALLATLADGAESDVGKITLTGGKAVKAPERANVYFIAAKIQASGLSGKDVGVWATNSLEASGGLLLAVDGLAQQFTVWPDGNKSKADVSSTEAGVKDAKACVT